MKTTIDAGQNTPSCGVWFGWFVICVHDYQEPEGTVLLPGSYTPKKGDKINIPSDGSEWIVDNVNANEGTLTVIK